MRLASAHAARRRRDVAGAVLRLPGEALTHRAPLDLGPEALDRRAFACRPCALDELHHANAMAASERAQRESEGRGRLAFARAGVDDEQAFFENRLGGDFRVLRGLALGHFGFVAVVFDAAHGTLSGEGGALLGALRPDLKSGRA